MKIVPTFVIEAQVCNRSRRRVILGWHVGNNYLSMPMERIRNKCQYTSRDRYLVYIVIDFLAIWAEGSEIND